MAKKSPSNSALFKKITDALRARDVTTVVDMLSKNDNAKLWVDATGKNLAHYAVALNVENLLQTFIDVGGVFLQTDHQGYTPLDVATGFGHTGCIDILKTAKEKTQKNIVCGRLAYRSLSELRAASEKQNKNIFYDLIKQGSFQSVWDLVKGSSDPLLPSDLLSPAANGETVLFEMCKQGHVEKLFDTDIWTGRVREFEKVLKKIPRIYLETVDVVSFQKELRRSNLKNLRRQRRSGLSL